MWKKNKGKLTPAQLAANRETERLRNEYIDFKREEKKQLIGDLYEQQDELNLKLTNLVGIRFSHDDGEDEDEKYSKQLLGYC